MDNIRGRIKAYRATGPVSPGQGGLELCKKLRATEFKPKTPVVFVTGLKDFETQAQSVLTGATDLIAKPVLLTELALKASI